MKSLLSAITAVAAVAIAGCAKTTSPAPDLLLGSGFATSQTSSLALTEVGAEPNTPVKLQVEAVRVSVPESLTVSEANSYYPHSDIVWRGDPLGDRHDQIQSIFETAADRAADRLSGDTAVIVDIEVERFHSLTEKTRYTVGGVHSIRFALSLRDPETGALLAGPQKIKADLEGYGGQQAIDADQQGMTQKVRITHHLASTIFAHLGGVLNQDDAPLTLEAPSAEPI